jgi:hypothetical protein
MKKLLKNLIKEWRNTDPVRIMGFCIYAAAIFFAMHIGTSLCTAGSLNSIFENGDLNKGKFFPEGWIVPESKSVSFIKADPFHDRVLKLERLDFASTDVISYRSPIVEVNENHEYRFESDIKMVNSGISITIVGYGDVKGESRPVYKAINTFKADHGGWKRIEREFIPGSRTYKVKSLQVFFTLSRASGKVYIDNISLISAIKALDTLI